MTNEATVAANTNVVLKWTGATHDVYQFADKTKYDNCDFAGATEKAAAAASGAYTYAANTAGTFYFGCKQTGHCAGKQKLALTVTAVTTAASGTTTLAAETTTLAAETTTLAAETTT